MSTKSSLLFALLATPLISWAAGETSWCLADSCLGDPMAKYSQLKPAFRAYDMGRTRSPRVPECEPISPTGPNQEFVVGGLPPATEMHFWPHPAYAKGPVAQYFRLSSIEKHYPEISDADARRLAEQIVERTGEQAELIKQRYGYQVRAATGAGDNIVLAVTTTSAKLQLKPGSQRFSATAFKAQPGCTNPAPRL